MKSKMRRQDRALKTAETEQILHANEYGVLSMIDVDGEPYGVPLSYCYENEKIYFHCSVDGYKLENIRVNDKASFCVVGNTTLLPDQFSTKYESVIASGTVSEVTGEEKIVVLKMFINKYASNYQKEGYSYIHEANDKVCVLMMNISNITGKARR